MHSFATAAATVGYGDFHGYGVPEAVFLICYMTMNIALGAYISFAASDAMGYSGVLTVFFSGLTMSHYAWHSLSADAQKCMGYMPA